MTKTKTTKRALISSVLALFLCFTMLLGTTFAWFTDSVTSAGNIIQSGNLDVAMYWAEGEDAVPADSKDWNDASTGAIFDYDKWEPGYAVARHIRIANEGTLALKYNVKIVANGDVSELADVIDVYYLDPADKVERADLTEDTKLGNLTQVLAGIKVSAFGDLLAGEKHEITLVLKMQETAGNEYMNKSIGASFSVQLLATQLTAEEDSFDDQYDANAWTEVAEVPTPDANGVVNVYTAEQLAGVMANTAGIKTINIIEDINLADRTWGPAFVTAPGLVINGNGHTISNMTTSGASNVGFIGAAYQDITIKDLTFKNATVKATGSFVGIVIGNGWGGNAITLDNVDVIDSEASTSIPTKAIRIGALIGYSPYTRGDLTIKNCDVTGSTIAGYHNVGAMVGTMMFYGPEQGTITIENSTAKNNTLKYGSPNVGAFAFGASTSGYTEYIPASGFTAENNKVVAIANNANLETLVNNGAAEIELSAGTYTFPTNVKSGQTIKCADGVVFEGVSALNINGATVTGATFDAANNTDFNKGAGTGTINGTFKDCTFSGNNGLRYCYAGETVVFENCIFSGDTYGAHFDGGANEVIFKNCTFSGFNAFGSALTKLTMEGCTFKANGISGYNGINMWGSTDLINCTFVFDGTASYEWVDACGDNTTITAIGCVISDGTTERALVASDIGDYGTGNTITIK